MNILSVFYEHMADAMKQENLSLKEICAKVKQFGFDGVELDANRIKNEGGTILPALKNAGLAVNSIYNFFAFGCADGTIESDRAEALRVIQYCEQTNCKFLLAVAGFLTNDELVRGSAPYEARRLRMAASLTELTAAAAKRGITVVMEDFDNLSAPYSRAEELLWFMQHVPGLYESAWKSQFLSGLMQPIMAFVGNLGYAGVAISGGLLAIRGTIGVGDIQAFIQYVKNFTQPIQQIAQVINQVQSMTAASERVFEFLEEEEEDQEHAGAASVENVKGEVKFSHVSFGYNPNQTIIKDFSVDVKPGQKIAIVGPTGAGKTTMVKLLMRFYDVNSGQILLDGHDVRDYNRRDLRKAFGMVLQDTWLYKGTIMENIRYGRLDATDEEVIEAAKAAHADSFIRTLPGGYNMELNEDASNVSQGQKQLLTIARAILADSKVMILDEATSSVDTRTEALIQKAMDNLMEGRTSFVIAHRLSTIKNADVILVMKDGDIIEQGNHEELLAKNGFYAQLYNSQFEEAA